MLRKEIIKNYINTEDVQHIIWHNWSVFVNDTFKIIIFLSVLYIIYLWLSSYVTWQFLPWIFGAIWIGFFVKFILDFLNLYLDALVLSSNGITLFMRDGINKYKTDFFERSKIQMVSHTQNSARDKIFAKGDIVIRLEHDIEFPFENVSSPSKQVAKILHLKDKHHASKKSDTEKTSKLDTDKMAILTEALSEVVKEYLDKKERAEEEESSFL